jgi:hypothetical protein
MTMMVTIEHRRCQPQFYRIQRRAKPLSAEGLRSYGRV